MEFLGRGKSRIVFAENEDMVLKIAELDGHGPEVAASQDLPPHGICSAMAPGTQNGGYHPNTEGGGFTPSQIIVPLEDYLEKHAWTSDLLYYAAIVISKAAEKWKLQVETAGLGGG